MDFLFLCGFLRVLYTTVTQHFVAVDSVSEIEKLKDCGSCGQLTLLLGDLSAHAGLGPY